MNLRPLDGKVHIHDGPDYAPGSAFRVAQVLAVGAGVSPLVMVNGQVVVPHAGGSTLDANGERIVASDLILAVVA